MFTKNDYQDALNRIAICKNSKDYQIIKELINKYYEEKQERADMLLYMRNQCRRLERWSKQAKAYHYMKWFLGPFYHSKKNTA